MPSAPRLFASAALLLAVLSGNAMLASRVAGLDFEGDSSASGLKDMETLVQRLKGFKTTVAAAPPGNRYSGESGDEKIPVATPGSINDAYATCSPLRGPEPWGVCIEFKVLSAQGHNHDSGMPEIELVDSPQCYEDVPGDVPRVFWKFKVPEFASDFKIIWRYSGKCQDKVQDLTAPVGIQGLEEVPLSSDYDLLAGTREHPRIHYLAPKALKGFQALVAHYRRAFPENRLLIVSNASLPQGGLLDLYGDWSPPFSGHRHGFEIDILTKPIPDAARSDFEGFIASSGARFMIEEDHYHLDYSGSSSQELSCY